MLNWFAVFVLVGALVVIFLMQNPSCQPARESQIQVDSVWVYTVDSTGIYHKSFSAPKGRIIEAMGDSGFVMSDFPCDSIVIFSSGRR